MSIGEFTYRHAEELPKRQRLKKDCERLKSATETNIDWSIGAGTNNCNLVSLQAAPIAEFDNWMIAKLKAEYLLETRRHRLYDFNATSVQLPLSKSTNVSP
ncbi:MAG TPA: hypothetical protein VK513_13150 [Terriglobales bacterium]|nr:hypothetical protein [Terriglobales bacterium]